MYIAENIYIYIVNYIYIGAYIVEKLSSIRDKYWQRNGEFVFIKFALELYFAVQRIQLIFQKQLREVTIFLTALIAK